MRIAVPNNALVATVPFLIILGFFLLGHSIPFDSNAPNFPEPEPEPKQEVVEEIPRSYVGFFRPIVVNFGGEGEYLKVEISAAVGLSMLGLQQFKARLAENEDSTYARLTSRINEVALEYPDKADFLGFRSVLAEAIKTELNEIFSTNAYPDPIAEILFRAYIRS